VAGVLKDDMGAREMLLSCIAWKPAQNPAQCAWAQCFSMFSAHAQLATHDKLRFTSSHFCFSLSLSLCTPLRRKEHTNKKAPCSSNSSSNQHTTYGDRLTAFGGSISHVHDLSQTAQVAEEDPRREKCSSYVE
jgi:hypothetical protein